MINSPQATFPPTSSRCLMNKRTAPQFTSISQWLYRFRTSWSVNSPFFLSPAVDTLDTSGVSQHVPLFLPQPPLPLKSTPSPSTTLHQLSDRAGTEPCPPPLILLFSFLPFLKLSLSLFFSHCSSQIFASLRVSESSSVPFSHSSTTHTVQEGEKINTC